MQSTRKQIETKISKSIPGEIFFSTDFSEYGTPENIRQILSRLEKEDVLERIAQGIYLKPKRDPLLGILYPPIEEIAEKIAKRDKARIAPTGVMALYLLGLSTQIPLKIAYLTDGSQRQIKIGKHKILFKQSVPKNFAIKEERLHLIVQAFREKGQREITEDFLKRIEKHIKKLDVKLLETQLKYAPVWIQKEILKLYNN